MRNLIAAFLLIAYAPYAQAQPLRAAAGSIDINGTTSAPIVVRGTFVLTNASRQGLGIAVVNGGTASIGDCLIPRIVGSQVSIQTVVPPPFYPQNEVIEQLDRIDPGQAIAVTIEGQCRLTSNWPARTHITVPLVIWDGKKLWQHSISANDVPVRWPKG